MINALLEGRKVSLFVCVCYFWTWRIVVVAQRCLLYTSQIIHFRIGEQTNYARRNLQNIFLKVKTGRRFFFSWLHKEQIIAHFARGRLGLLLLFHFSLLHHFFCLFVFPSPWCFYFPNFILVHYFDVGGFFF